MVLKKQSFISYTVGEKDPLVEGKVLTVRLNKEEYAQLMVMSKALNISRESTTLKRLSIVGQNVILNTLGIDFMRWLMDEDRIIDESKLDKLVIEKKENVIQKEVNL